jgi:putative mRNA 3-end processing factor
VVSGDYKLEDDGVTTPFEPVRCHTFISESTFGLPIFNWKPQSEVFDQLHLWWSQNAASGISSVVFAYALGKAQRILAHLDRSITPIFLHRAITGVSKALGMDLALFSELDVEAMHSERPALFIATPSASGASWLSRLGAYRTASASGWMAIRGLKRRSGVDKGFVLSDHADFRGLNRAIADTGAERIYLTHGYTEQFARWLRESAPALDVREL